MAQRARSGSRSVPAATSSPAPRVGTLKVEQARDRGKHYNFREKASEPLCGHAPASSFA
jgi:hypothetical protein